MTEATPEPTVLLSEAEVARRVAALAEAIAPRIDDDTVAICLLTGGLWFCSDLMRALARLGRHVRFDALWLASYGDERASLGRCEVRADLQRPLSGRRALIVDDVIDTGRSLSEAARLVRDSGAAEVLTCVFAANTDLRAYSDAGAGRGTEAASRSCGRRSTRPAAARAAG